MTFVIGHATAAYTYNIGAVYTAVKLHLPVSLLYRLSGKRQTLLGFEPLRYLDRPSILFVNLSSSVLSPFLFFVDIYFCCFFCFFFCLWVLIVLPFLSFFCFFFCLWVLILLCFFFCFFFVCEYWSFLFFSASSSPPASFLYEHASRNRRDLASLPVSLMTAYNCLKLSASQTLRVGKQQEHRWWLGGWWWRRW